MNTRRQGLWRAGRKVGMAAGAATGLVLAWLAVQHLGLESIAESVLAATPVWMLVAFASDVRVDDGPRRGLARRAEGGAAWHAGAPPRHSAEAR